MIKISSVKDHDGNYKYESMIMEQGASTPWKRWFESKYHMVSTMNDILARQRRAGDIRHLLNNTQRGVHYFFDVDITEKQAELLGWNNAVEAQPLSRQTRTCAVQ